MAQIEEQVVLKHWVAVLDLSLVAYTLFYNFTASTYLYLYLPPPRAKIRRGGATRPKGRGVIDRIRINPLPS